jgi:hypothetical protein
VIIEHLFNLVDYQLLLLGLTESERQELLAFLVEMKQERKRIWQSATAATRPPMIIGLT